MNDKRNPSIIRGTGEDVDSYLGRIREYISKLEWQSEGHRLWYTHKNPYGCWICEILQVCRELETLSMDRSRTNGNDLDDDDDYDYNYNEEPDDTEVINNTKSDKL